MTDLVRVNSTIYSWTSCSWKIDMIPYNGIKSLDYADKRERPVVHAGRKDGRPVGKPSGKYSVDAAKLVTLRDTADVITTYLTTKGLGSYGDAEFVLLFQAAELIPNGVGSPALTVMLEGCTIDGVHESQDEGTGELTTEFDIGALQLTRNGKRLWSVARGLV